MKIVLMIFLSIIVSFSCFSQDFKKEIEDYRETYKNDLLSDERTPLKKEDAQYLRFFEPDEDYKVEATFTKTDDAVAFDLPTSSGKTKQYIEYGKLQFTLFTRPMTLTIYQGIKLLENPETRDYLFLPFTDPTNGEESYINGRYLDFKIDDIKDGKLELDFNKAYNPYCAYSDGFNCPKPPAANAMTFPVKAGERDFGLKRH